MSNLVIIDSQIFIWGIKLEHNENQPLDVQRARTLIKIIEQNKYKIVIPAPQLAELLSGCDPNKRQDFLSSIVRKYQIIPFDNLAAVKFGELLHNSLRDSEIKEFRTNFEISKSRMKFDYMIISIGITRGIKSIYTHDSGFKKFANGLIPIKMLNDVPAQLNLLNEIEMEDDFNEDLEDEHPF